MIDFLQWLAKAGGIVTIIITLLGFIFKEKWKQILQRSLLEDVERLKDSLVKSQAEHAASLTPQLEQIKHDFQQKLEAYKVSLIAQAEAVKAKGELKKSIAMRYSEIEFERLIVLERIIASIASEIGSFATIDIKHKNLKHVDQSYEKIDQLNTACLEVEMFISLEDHADHLVLRKELLDIISKYVGPNLPSLPNDGPEITSLITAASNAHTKLKNRIKSLGEL